MNKDNLLDTPGSWIAGSIKNNLNASRPSEHPSVGGGKAKTFR